MIFRRQLLPVFMAAIILASSLAAGRQIFSISDYGASLPPEMVGEFTGGIIQRNASTGEETMNFIEYYSVDSAGKFWGLFKPIMGEELVDEGRVTSVTAIVAGSNYTVHREGYLGGFGDYIDCFILTLTTDSKNETGQEFYGAYGEDCPADKATANYTGWLKTKSPLSDEVPSVALSQL